MKSIKTLVEERRQKLEVYGRDWADKPNDMLMWMMDAAQGEEQSIPNLSLEMLVLNFTAIHTSSTAFAHMLYHLAAEPNHIKPLREEVESVIAADGWTKTSMGKMRKIDSFIRESQRLHGPGHTSMARLAIKPFTFSNGMTVPVGNLVACSSRGIHTDNTKYPNADVFDGFRFSKMRETEATKYQMVSTNPEYLAFGHGKHACPGRFFVANELKLMLAHIIVSYDVTFEDGQGFPPDLVLDEANIPGKADVMVRRRQGWEKGMREKYSY
ncbi:cytochrome P450 [Artomyces pyxidatus]|uniref:Cytochrome P450 n=1 Tax=Artomyces pyxidatus TaxID=48021 RepID=A0ACB8SV03_9AGAM|nr:cytochrome P450 [Artomyces pyxidatus]